MSIFDILNKAESISLSWGSGHDDGSLVCIGACYWYKGVNKNIPFTLTKTQISKL